MHNLLANLLSPTSIVIAGASNDTNSVANRVARNIINGGFAGELYLVNAKHRRILDLPTYGSIRKLPKTPDLAIILTPADTLERMIDNCAEAGIKVALIMTLTDKRADLTLHAHKRGVRILGPGSAGLIRPGLALNATYSENSVSQGKLAVISQSAALISAVIDWADKNAVGFSTLLATGAELDISMADIVDLLAVDQSTNAIILYIDKIPQARKFLSAINAAARNKPVIVMKSTQDSSHYCHAVTRTGNVYTSDRIFQAALERAGAVRIRTFSNLFSAARTLSAGQRTNGKRLAIVSNGAAPAMLACDRIQAKNFELPPLSDTDHTGIDQCIAGNWSQVNPVVIRNYETILDTFSRTVELLLASNEFDAVLALYCPDPRYDALALAKEVSGVASKSAKPVLTCWMGDTKVAASRGYFNTHGVLTFRTPEAATDAFDFLYRYFRSQQLLVQVPDPIAAESRSDFNAIRTIASAALAQTTRVLSPEENSQILSIMGISQVPNATVHTLEQAMKAANQIGYPITLKLASPSLQQHRSIQGFETNLMHPNEVESAWLRIAQGLKKAGQSNSTLMMLVSAADVAKRCRVLTVRVFNDATFSRTIAIGFGGDMQAIVTEQAVQLPPLNQYLIDDLLADEHLRKYLSEHWQQPAANRTALADFLQKFSTLICEVPEIYEIEFNAVLLDHEALRIDNMQTVVQPHSANPSNFSHLSIHPYPHALVHKVTLKNGQSVTIRPVRAEDGEAIAAMVSNMSAESRYMRFMHAMENLPPKMIAQFTKIDYDRQMAFCAVPDSDPSSIIAVSRYTINPDRTSSEFAIASADQWRGLGLSKQLMNTLIERAKQQGLSSLEGGVLRINTSMRGMMESLGFECTLNKEEPEQLVCRLTIK